jgi:hypothetical protein
VAAPPAARGPNESAGGAGPARRRSGEYIHGPLRAHAWRESREANTHTSRLDAQSAPTNNESTPASQPVSPSSSSIISHRRHPSRHPSHHHLHASIKGNPPLFAATFFSLPTSLFSLSLSPSSAQMVVIHEPHLSHAVLPSPLPSEPSPSNCHRQPAMEDCATKTKAPLPG